MLKIINEGIPTDTIWDDKGSPPSIIYLEDSTDQCIAQILCSNAQEQAKYTRLLAASTDMLSILTDLSEAISYDQLQNIVKNKVVPLLNSINKGTSNG